MSKRIYYSKDGTRVYGGITPIANWIMRQWDSEPYSRSGTYAPNQIGGNNYIVFQFPAATTIDRIYWRYAKTLNADMWLQVSSNTTDGSDGTWTSVYYNNGAGIGSNVHIDVTTPTSSKWFRLRYYNWIYVMENKLYAFHLYGSYDTPRFTNWETDEVTEITDNTWLDFSEAPNHLVFSETKSFKVRNDTAETQDYTITATMQDYAGSTTIDNCFFISEDDGDTPVKTFTMAGILPGAFTPTIYAHMDISLANNPGVAAHYPRIQIEEV
jgi:hypothetical protein